MSLFSNKTKINITKDQNRGFFSFSVKTPVTSIPPIVTNYSSPSAEPPVKKMKWGEPTWYLFHTLSHKMKDEYFFQIKNDFLQICFLICRYLPCPLCAEHATQHMQGINFNAINTKQQLKDLFFEFHNIVNKKKGFAIFSKTDLDDKYSKAITINIIQNFMFYFRDRSKSIRMIADDFFRERTIKQLNEWFSKNLQYFDS
jgi:hypothetical protein